MTVGTLDDGTLVVECSHSDCEDRRTFDGQIEAEMDSPTRTDWELLTTISVGGEVKVHEAYCPEHRMETALKEVLTASKELSKSTARVSQATQAVSDIDFDIDE